MGDLHGPIYITSGYAFLLGSNDEGPVVGPGDRIFAVPLPLGVGDSPPSLFAGGTFLQGTYYADNNAVFWFNGNSQLVSCPVTGCAAGTAPEVLANGSSSYLTSDGQALYWIAINSTNTSGVVTSASVMKLAR